MTETIRDATKCARCNHKFRDGEYVEYLPVSGVNVHDKAHGGCSQVTRPPAGLPPSHTHAATATGQALAEQGAKQAFDSLDERLSSWRSDATQAMDYLIRQGESFTSDDVADLVGNPPKPNAMGGLLMAHKHRLDALGYTTTKRAAGHNRVIRVWQAKSSTVEQ